MFMPILYEATVAASALTSLSNIASESILQTGGASTTYKIPANLQWVVGVYADGNVTNYAELQAPSLLTRYGAYADFSPVDLTDNAVISANQIPWHDLFGSQSGFSPAFQVDAGDSLGVQTAQSASTSKVVTCVVWLSSVPNHVLANPAPPGPVITVRATGSTTLVAYTWTQVAITLQKSLKPGTYAVGGLRYEGASAYSARFVGITKDGTRPGCLGVLDAKTPEPHGAEGARFRHFHNGVWGYFSADNVPNIEVIAKTTDSAQTFYLDLVKVS